MTRIAFDTSVLFGLLDPKDAWHGQAVEIKRAVQTYGSDVAVLDCVLAEAISTMARRIHEQRRTSDLNQLVSRILTDYPADDVLWVLPDVPVLYTKVLDLVRASGGELNFNDALIALSCRYRDIPLIASFDHDFDQVTWLKRIAGPNDLFAFIPAPTPAPAHPD